MKKLLSLALALCITLSLCVTGVFANDSVPVFDISDRTATNAAWKYENGKLCIYDDIVLTGSSEDDICFCIEDDVEITLRNLHAKNESIGCKCSVQGSTYFHMFCDGKVGKNLTLILEGENYVKALNIAVYLGGNITIDGTGTLNDISSEGNSSSIRSDAGIVVNGGTLKLNSDLYAWDDLYINGGTVNSEGYVGAGNVLTVNGGTVNVNRVNTHSFEMNDGTLIAEDSMIVFQNMTVNGGTVNVKGYIWQRGPVYPGDTYTGSITISGGVVNVDKYCNLYGNFTMTGGSFTANTSYDGDMWCTFPALYVGKDFSMTGGCFNANVDGESVELVGTSIENASVIVKGEFEYAYVNMLSGELVRYYKTVADTSDVYSSESYSYTGTAALAGGTEDTDYIVGIGDLHICTEYSITVDESVKDYIEAQDSAYIGETVEVTVKAPTGYTLKALYVNDEEIEGTSFVMPEADVVVSAEFVKSAVSSSASESSSAVESSSQSQVKNAPTSDMSLVGIAVLALVAFAVAVITIKKKSHS